MQLDEALWALANTSGARFDEIAQVTTFKAIRRAVPPGAMRLVTIEISDRGPGAPRGLRFSCVVTDDRGATAMGNPADDLRLVLDSVHWFDLDRDAPGQS